MGDIGVRGAVSFWSEKRGFDRYGGIMLSGVTLAGLVSFLARLCPFGLG
jgi:pantothenate kinase